MLRSSSAVGGARRPRAGGRGRGRVGVVAGRLRQRAVVDDPPSWTTTARVISGCSGPSSCATSSTVPPPADEARAAPRRTPPGWRRPRRPWARRGPAARARPASARAMRIRCCCPPDRATRAPGPVGEADRGRAPRRPRAGRRRHGRAAARAGRAGPRRRPRARSPARRCPRRGAAGRSRCRRHGRKRSQRRCRTGATSPAASGTRPSADCTRVDLPEPLAPRIATTSPRAAPQVDAVEHRPPVVGDDGPVHLKYHAAERA